MAWEDRTPFDAIKFQFGLSESDVKALMKKELKFTSYKLWRSRVENCKTKHSAKRVEGIERFKCNLQRAISNNKISKRH
nr:TIGR03643 family protein [Flavobacterium sp. MC2016-06]